MAASLSPSPDSDPDPDIPDSSPPSFHLVTVQPARQTLPTCPTKHNLANPTNPTNPIVAWRATHFRSTVQ
jgi:hypothetical protein